MMKNLKALWNLEKRRAAILAASFLVVCFALVKDTGGVLAARGDAPENAMVSDRPEQDAYFFALNDYVNRSPGERGEVTFAKGSGRFRTSFAPPLRASEPTQRALGKIFEPEEPDLDMALAGENFSPLTLGAIGDPGLPLEVTVPSVQGSAPGASPSTGNSAIPPLLLIGSPSSSSPEPAPVPAAPVPEPGIWALLLTGFFLAGSALRFRRDPAIALRA